MVWHLYGVAEWNPGAVHPPAGKPGHGAGELPPGVLGAPVELVAHEELVVAASPLERPLECPQPQDLARHAGVACWLMTAGATVLPFRFGVAAPSRTVVVELVRCNEPLLRSEIHRLRGKAEAAVVAFWDRQAVLRELIKDAEARRWLGFSRSVPRAAATAVQARLGELTEQLVRAWRERYGTLLRRSLAPHVLQLREREPIGIRMLLNFAALIPAGSEPQLEAAVDQLQARLQGRIRFRVTAPLPPFVFTELALTSPPGRAGATPVPAPPPGGDGGTGGSAHGATDVAGDGPGEGAGGPPGREGGPPGDAGGGCGGTAV